MLHLDLLFLDYTIYLDLTLTYDRYKLHL